MGGFGICNPEQVQAKNYKFFRITQMAYIFGGTTHFMLGLLFIFVISVPPMALFNFIFSVPAFTASYMLNRKGRHNLAFSLAFIELITHQVAGVYFVGWKAGFQFYLIYLAGLVFFNRQWNRKIRTFCLTTISLTYALLYIYLRTPNNVLTPLQYQIFFLTAAITIMIAITQLIHYYVKVASNAEDTLLETNKNLSEKKKELAQTLSLLNRELSEAAEYVKTALPPTLKEGCIKTDWHFAPSSSLGGDAFGYHWIDDDHFAMYLADVSGHGVGAALLSVSVMNTLRSGSLADVDFTEPDNVLEGLNMAFPGEENNHLFFTIWYGVYNKQTRELKFASGGHPPALLQRESAMTQLATKNITIGVIPEAPFVSSNCQIHAGDKLYLYSDGVYELKLKSGALWQFEEFVNYLCVEDDADSPKLKKLHQQTMAISDGALEDDFTIVEIVFV